MRVTFERAPPVPIHPCTAFTAVQRVNDRCLSGGDIRAPNLEGPHI